MKTAEYTPELYGRVMERMLDYHQIGWTVCGAQDPAVISLAEPIDGYTVVRVKERYVSAWKSDTYLEFSNDEITTEEYGVYEELVDSQL